MHATDTLVAVSGLRIARAAAQGIGSSARQPIASRVEAGASTAARTNLADAFGPALADHCIAKGGTVMVFRGNGTVEAI